MEPNRSSVTPTPANIAVRYGLLTGLVNIIVSFILNVSHLEQSPAKWLTMLVLIAGIVLAQRTFRQTNAGFMSYGQGLGAGMFVASLASVLSGIFSYIYVSFIDPDMVTRILEKGRADMEARGGMSDTQIDNALQWTSKLIQGPILLVVVVVSGILMGLFISLLAAAFTKNPQPEFE